MFLDMKKERGFEPIPNPRNKGNNHGTKGVSAYTKRRQALRRAKIGGVGWIRTTFDG